MVKQNQKNIMKNNKEKLKAPARISYRNLSKKEKDQRKRYKNVQGGYRKLKGHGKRHYNTRNILSLKSVFSCI